MSDRQLALAKRLAERAGLRVFEVDALIAALGDDALMAELMAVCARPGPAPWDGGFEFVAGAGGHVPDGWLPGGVGLPVTHWLPEPHRPPR